MLLFIGGQEIAPILRGGRFLSDAMGLGKGG